MIIDVSTYQGVINWPAIAADQIELAIIKATEGIGFTDARFAQNWAGAKAAGVPRGAYHFAHPDAGNDPVAEASYFLGVVEAHGLVPTDILAEDYEVPGGGPAWSLAFLGHLEGLVANLLAFYSNYSGCARVNDVRMARFPLWLAYPGDGVHVPLCPAPWRSIALWQYRVGTISGITGGVDEDVNLGLFAGDPSHQLEEPMNLNTATKEFFIQLCWLATTGHTAPDQNTLTNGDGHGRPGTAQIAPDGSNLNVVIAQFATQETAPAYLAGIRAAAAAAGAAVPDLSHHKHHNDGVDPASALTSEPV